MNQDNVVCHTLTTNIINEYDYDMIMLMIWVRVWLWIRHDVLWHSIRQV